MNIMIIGNNAIVNSTDKNLIGGYDSLGSTSRFFSLYSKIEIMSAKVKIAAKLN